MLAPSPFTLSPFSPDNIMYMGVNFPLLTSFFVFFLFPLFIFIERGMDDQKAILIASIIGYFMYFGFAFGIPDAMELFEFFKSKDEKM